MELEVKKDCESERRGGEGGAGEIGFCGRRVRGSGEVISLL